MLELPFNPKPTPTYDKDLLLEQSKKDFDYTLKIASLPDKLEEMNSLAYLSTQMILANIAPQNVLTTLKHIKRNRYKTPDDREFIDIGIRLVSADLGLYPKPGQSLKGENADLEAYFRAIDRAIRLKQDPQPLLNDAVTLVEINQPPWTQKDPSSLVESYTKIAPYFYKANHDPDPSLNKAYSLIDRIKYKGKPLTYLALGYIHCKRYQKVDEIIDRIKDWHKIQYQDIYPTYYLSKFIPTLIDAQLQDGLIYQAIESSKKYYSSNLLYLKTILKASIMMAERNLYHHGLLSTAKSLLENAPSDIKADNLPDLALAYAKSGDQLEAVETFIKTPRYIQQEDILLQPERYGILAKAIDAAGFEAEYLLRFALDHSKVARKLDDSGLDDYFGMTHQAFLENIELTIQAGYLNLAREYIQTLPQTGYHTTRLCSFLALKEYQLASS